MIQALEKLKTQPGVDLVMFVTPDGVPIATVGDVPGDEHAPGASANGVSNLGRDDAVAALAVGWANELKLATAPLSWDEPQRVVMRCARGSLVMQRTRGAILLVLLARGVAPDDLRLPMEGTVARIERTLQRKHEHAGSHETVSDEPPGPIPSEKGISSDEGLTENSSNTHSREGLSGT